MKKVINITLGGVVFAIEQEAYDTLASYLEGIKQNIIDSDDVIEIVSDIEIALAEKFLARKRSEKMAVTVEDVSVVIKEMGNPSDFSEGETQGEGIGSEADTSSEKSVSEIKKRLYRDTDDAIIAGVASGLANYFDIDPVIVRILFVISVFFNGLGILAYIILWLVVPAAETATQKYAMRGEKMTVAQITERVKKKIDEVDTDELKNKAQNTWGGFRPVLVKAFDVLGVFVRVFVSAFRYIVGFALLIGGALATAGLVSVYSIVLLSDKAFIPADAQTALDIMIGSGLGIVAISASFTMLLIPFLVLVLVGGGLVAKRNLFTVGKSISLAVAWIISVVLAATTSILLVQQVMPVLNPEWFEHGSYQIHINVDDDTVEIDATTIIPPQEEDVQSAPPSSEPLSLTEGE